MEIQRRSSTLNGPATQRLPSGGLCHVLRDKDAVGGASRTAFPGQQESGNEGVNRRNLGTRVEVHREIVLSRKLSVARLELLRLGSTNLRAGS